jgi:hypothetical protein
MQRFQLTCKPFTKFLKDISNHVTQERHDSEVVLNKSKLDIEADIFVDMSRRVVWLCTENRTHFKDAFKDPHHNLLIELGTLSQVCISPEVIKFEDICPLSVADATIFGVCISVKSRSVKIERKADITPAESRKIARLSR